MSFFKINDIEDKEIRANLFTLLSSIKSIKSKKIIIDKIDFYSSLRDREKYLSDLYKAYTIYIQALEKELERRII